MICASKIGNGFDIGGFVLKPAVVGHEDHQKANAPGRERVAGFEITRGVPDDLWRSWYGANANGPIVKNGLVHGSEDFDELTSWCWQHAGVHGTTRAPQT